jgi:hypothetical protein
MPRHTLPAWAAIMIVGVAACLAAWGTRRVSSAGTDIGAIRLCGGPIAPGQCLTQDGRAEITDLGTHVVTTRETHHGATIQLPAGRYLLVATSGGTRGRTRAVIRRGATTRTNITIPIR